ncbi:hypothetical protein [Streptomyces erythrochromogenes]|uniref:hypothetical protein n=1 Tax=Streptomyces erythrochromogenes TaxID=285574 RepID=UPI0038663699|nr:hypothetical protein OG489_31605 [Streptomyces erythrochromogenes]
MTSPTPRGVWSLDTPDTGVGFAAVQQPSPHLLARAQAGFERSGTAEGPTGDE